MIQFQENAWTEGQTEGRGDPILKQQHPILKQYSSKDNTAKRWSHGKYFTVTL